MPSTAGCPKLPKCLRFLRSMHQQSSDGQMSAVISSLRQIEAPSRRGWRDAGQVGFAQRGSTRSTIAAQNAKSELLLRDASVLATTRRQSSSSALGFGRQVCQASTYTALGLRAHILAEPCCSVVTASDGRQPAPAARAPPLVGASNLGRLQIVRQAQQYAGSYQRRQTSCTRGDGLVHGAITCAVDASQRSAPNGLPVPGAEAATGISGCLPTTSGLNRCKSWRLSYLDADRCADLHDSESRAKEP